MKHIPNILAIVGTAGMAVWSIGWPDGQLSLWLGGASAFMSGALAGLEAAYWQIDRIIGRLEKEYSHDEA